MRILKKNFKLTEENKKKIKIGIICFIIFSFTIICGLVSGFVYQKLELIDTEETTTEAYIETTEKETEPITEPVIEPIKTQGITSATSINDYLYQWANNDAPLYSDESVINVLLIGLDSDYGLRYGGRSDSMILVSLNKKTKQINMTSIFRDSLCYIENKNVYDKLNSAYVYGGPTSLVNTIEKNMKIDINHYAVVDFTSFVEIIDALGGITVEVKQYEANYMNRTNRNFYIKAGSAVKLTGEQALVFARIRKCDADSDVSRTRRQRSVIEAVVNQFKNASLSEINNAIDILFSYIKTDLSKSEIVSYAAQGVAKGWISYEIVQHTLSDEEVFGTAYINKKSVVLLDFPLAAQRIQNAFYGDTNIELQENRIKLLDFKH